MVAASTELTPPVSQPYRHGLLAAATVIDDPSFAPRGEEYVWRTQGCTPGGTWEFCWTEGWQPDQIKTVFPDAWSDADPFTVFDGVRCPAIGMHDLDAVATSRLLLSEQGQVERRVWAELAERATVVEGPDGPFGSVDQAVGALEAAYQAVTGATGVLHLPRIANALAECCRFWRDGNTLRSGLSTPAAFGAGYSYQGPDGTVTPGQIWAYISGPVTIWRGPVHTYDRPSGFDLRSNDLFFLAERSYVVAIDCDVFAAPITVENLPPLTLPEPPEPFRMVVDSSDLSNVTATFTGANCAEVRINWGDGSPTTGATVTDGQASAAHDYTT